MSDRGQRAWLLLDQNRLNRGAEQNRRYPDRGGAPAQRAAPDLPGPDLFCRALRDAGAAAGGRR